MNARVQSMRASRKRILRNERNAFFALLGFSLALLVMPLPYLQVAASSDTARFERIDRNGDGFLDRAEARRVRRLAGDFDRIDRDRDARLDRVEFARW